MNNKEEDNLFEHFRFVADPGQSPIRIDKFLIDRIVGVSRNKIQNAASNGYVRVNDDIVKSNYKIRPNDVITIMMPEEPRERRILEPEEMDLDIVYEDADVIVLNKPAGLVVHPGVGNWTGTLVNGLVHHLGRSDIPSLPGNDATRPGIVHRIDKDTSGLMVVAKNEKALTHLAKQFYDHDIKREYIAIVWGEPEPEKGTITGHIGRNPSDNVKMKVFHDGEAGKHAVTHYEVIDPYYYISVVKCILETGRTHQIRVHMASKGHPLFNDVKYGGDQIKKGTIFSKYKQFVFNCFKLLERHALHAQTIGFVHPTTGNEMVFESELPEDMQNVIDKWQHYVTHQKGKQ